MGKSKIVSSLIAFVAVFVLLPSQVLGADAVQNSIGTNYDIIILTPGHARTIYYELDDPIFNNGSAFQATAILTLGAGTLSVSVGNNSPIEAGSEIVYATTGLVGTTPVLDYSYSSSPILLTIPVADFGVGMLITSVLYSVGSPDFPITMSMVFSLN